MNRILLGTSLEPRFSLLVYLFRGENLILRGGSPVGFRYANFSLFFTGLASPFLQIYALKIHQTKKRSSKLGVFPYRCIYS